MAFTERVVNEIKWDKPGIEIAGHLVSIREVEFEGKRNLGYSIKNAAGIWRFFGNTALNLKITKSDLGSAIKIAYLRDEDLGGGKTKKHFKVQFDPHDRVAAQEVPNGNRSLEITDDDIPF